MAWDLQFSIIRKHTEHQLRRRQIWARGLSPIKKWLSPLNKFRDSPGWKGLRATAVVKHHQIMNHGAATAQH